VRRGYCERCGGDRCLHSNHICKTTPVFGFPVDDVPTAEELAAKKQQDEECRGVAATIAAELAECEEWRFDKRAAEEARQLKMRADHEKWLEERRRQGADVETETITFDLKDQ
jgi:hypothetical protein